MPGPSTAAETSHGAPAIVAQPPTAETDGQPVREVGTHITLTRDDAPPHRDFHPPQWPPAMGSLTKAAHGAPGTIARPSTAGADGPALTESGRDGTAIVGRPPTAGADGQADARRSAQGGSVETSGERGIRHGSVGPSVQAAAQGRSIEASGERGIRQGSVGLGVQAGAQGGSVEAALAAVGRGEFAVVVDEGSEGSEGGGWGAAARAEGVLVLAAQAMTAERMAFMMRHTSGVIAVPLEGQRLDALQLPLMVADPAVAATAFTVSVDAHQSSWGGSTGVSAADRSHTVHALIDPGTKPADLARPGHVFPQRYREGGVLRRAGRGEAAVDLARLAGRQPAAVLAELVNDDGSLPQRVDLERFADDHRLPVVTIAELIAHRRRREKLVRQVSAARVPTPHGDFTAVVFASLLDGIEHVALVRGEVTGADAQRDGVAVHVHAECLTGDTFGSLRCDCGRRLDAALADIAAAGAGVLVYLRDHVGPARGLLHELHTDHHQDHVHADGIATQILTDLGATPHPHPRTNDPATPLARLA